MTIVSLAINEDGLVRQSRYQKEREEVLHDLLQEHEFTIKAIKAPYEITCEIRQNRLTFAFTSHPDIITMPLSPLRRTIKDYKVVCDSYLEAIKDADPRKVEAIDMGRRGLHNEGAEKIQELLEADITMDFETARKFFSLIYYMQVI